MSALIGYLDEAGREDIAGWAQISGSDKPVELDLFVAATFTRPALHLHRCLANRYRPDRDPDRALHRGRFGFALDARRLDLPRGSFCLEVRQVGGPLLPGTPRLIACATFDRGRPLARLVEVDGRPVARLPPDILLWSPMQGGGVRLTVPSGIAMVAVVTPQREIPGEARCLGVPVRRVALDGAEIPLASGALCQGFYPVESNDAGHVWRWAAPVAVMDLGPSARPRALEIAIGDPAAYPRNAPAGLRLQAAFLHSAGWDDACAAYIGRHWLTPPKQRRIVRPTAPCERS